jgi:signal transduction histidine kinase
MTDNAAMSIDALRRLMAQPDWPLISGLALAGLALVESTVYVAIGNEPDASLSVVCNLFATAPLVWRHTRPILVALVVTLATLMIALQPLTPSLAAVIGQGVAIYAVAERSRRWVAVVLALPFALYAMGDDDALMAAVLLGASVFGFVVGNSRRLTAERDAARGEQAAMGERARIARELHDVVAHHISMIVVQADTARLATPGTCCRSATRRATRWTSCAACSACCATTPAPRSSTPRSRASTSSTRCSTPRAARARRCG